MALNMKGGGKNVYIREYMNCCKDIGEQAMLMETGERLNMNAPFNKIKEQVSQFIKKSNIIVFANTRATLIKISKNASMVISPTHIIYLDEKAGLFYQVKDEALKVLYNSKKFKEEISNFINNKKTNGLIQTIMRYSILNNGINNAVKHFRKQGENEQQILENVGIACETKEEAGVIEYLQATEKRPLNNRAKAKLEHASKKFQEFALSKN